MSNFREDQAAGLRRIMAGPKPRIVSVISATPADDRSRMLKNLAASIADDGNDVMLVHATPDIAVGMLQYKLGNTPSLLDVASGKTTMTKAIKTSDQGYALGRLLSKQDNTLAFSNTQGRALDSLFHRLADAYDIVLVDTILNNSALALQSLNEGEIVIQLTRNPDSIKQAYVLIKQLCSKLGRRGFGIVVSDASHAQAEIVFRNIQQVARRFMMIELAFMGSIPPDEHLVRAEKLGRAVIDAFPMAQASSAFRAIAKQLDYRRAMPADWQGASTL